MKNDIINISDFQEDIYALGTGVDVNVHDLKILIEEVKTLSGNESDDEYFNDLIHTYIEHCKGIARPKAVYRVYSNALFNVEKDHLILNGTRFNVKNVVARELRKSELLVVFAVTAGAEIENHADKLMAEQNYPEGYIVNSIGSAFAEATADFIHDRVELMAKDNSMGVSNRFSPGYCNWDVSEQKELFSQLPNNACNIKLSKSALMMPIKSVSGVLGVGKEITKREYNCSFCSKIDCIMRKV